jgi:23S rRNA pseudouridine1911/1915/1917 synthase
MADIEYKVEELNPRILYADNHLLAVNKPAGMLTQDSGTGLFNMEDWAREWVRVDKNKEGKVFLNAVHRIDKAVSGVVLFARTSKALSRLNEVIRKRNCKKIDHALVEGAPGKPKDELIHWLIHEHHRAEVCREGAKGAQRAVLRYRILNQNDPLTLLEIDLETGRYHQIRVQLSTIGSPIAGDEKYGAKQRSKKQEIALHHAQLEVTHPISKESITVKAPYPGASEWWSRV